MTHDSFFQSINRFGNTPAEICLNTLGLSLDKIQKNVVISPGWFPEKLYTSNEIEELVQSSPLFQYKIWNITHNNTSFTYVKTGFGSSVVMDFILLLGITGKCEKLVFLSSVGALSDEFNIGDIVIPQYAISGTGAERYLSHNPFDDCFNSKHYPHPLLFNNLVEATNGICQKHNIRWHYGKTFCVDTIVAQYNHLNSIINAGCDSIDMESSTAFNTSTMLGIPCVAILNVSDSPNQKKQISYAKASKR